MQETAELIFKVQTHGIDALDKAAGTVKQVSLETKYGATSLQTFEKILGVVVKSGESYRSALEAISKSGKELDKTTVQIAKDLLEQDRAFKQATVAAEKATKESEQRFREFASNVKGAIQNPFNAAGEAVEGMLLKLGPTGAIAIGAAAGLGIAAKAAFDLSAATGSLAEEHLNLSERTGLSVKEVGTFSGAAQIAGVNIGAIVASMRTFSQALSENSAEGKKGKQALQELGVEALDVQGHIRPMGDLWLDIADAISKIENPAERARLAMALFGRGGLELMPLLRGNFRELTKEVEALGYAFTEDGAKKAAAYDDALGKLELKWQSLKRALGEKIIGIIDITFPSLLNGDAPARDPITGRPLGGESYDRKSRTNSDELSGVVIANLRKRGGTFTQQDYRDELERVRSEEAYRKYDGPRSESRSERARSVRDLTEGGNLLSGLERSYSGSEAGRQGRLGEVNAEIDKLRSSLLARDGKGLASEVGPQIEKLKKLEAERDAIQRNIEGQKQYSSAVQEAQQFVEQATNAHLTGIAKIIRERDRLTGQLRGGDPLTGQVNAAAAGQVADEVKRIQGEARKALSETEKTADADRTRRMEWSAKAFGEAMRKEMGGDSEAIRALEKSLNDVDREQKQAEREREHAERERQQAEKQHEREMLQLRKEREQIARNEASDLYRSLRSGQGFGGYMAGKAEQFGEQVFTNATAPIFERMGDQLAGSLGGSELLKGTIFGSRSTPVDKNTDATEKNTKATERLEKTLSRTGGAAAGASGSGYSGDLTSDLLTFGSDVTGITGQSGKSTARMGRLDSAIFSAAGMLGVYQGLAQGGGRGISNAISSGLSTAAAIPGPQQPFMMAGALIAGFVGNLFGDPKVERAQKMDAFLAASRYQAPTAINRVTDMAGNAIHYDYAGNARTSAPTIVVQVQALDSQSFLDRSGDIADAVAAAMGDGHKIATVVQRTVAPL